MRKTLAVVILLVTCVCLVPGADASTLTFQNLTAVSGVTVSVPYKANAGTEWDPDTVTLLVDLAAPTLSFKLTAVGAGFTSGNRFELDWDDDSYGAPREQYIQLTNGGFSFEQSFSFAPSRLRLTAGQSRTADYELDVDVEPDSVRGDVERHLRVTFTATGTAPTNPPTNPSNPTLLFQDFTAGNGVTVSVPYKANAGTEWDPDTVTLLVDLGAPTLEFGLTAVGSGFTSGNWFELDWDDDSLGTPREQYITLTNGGFSIPQNISFAPSRLRLNAGQTRDILYELDVDVEPDSARGDRERHLRVTFTTTGSVSPTDPTTPTTPTTPTNPTGPTLLFQDITAGSGVRVSVPYKANAGTEYDPDTVTLLVDLSVPTLEFQVATVGDGFSSGRWCELDWDDDSLGAPREEYMQLSSSSFNILQNFSLAPSRLRLTNGGTRSILYELDADEEPDSVQGDVERHLLITFTTSSTTNPLDPGGYPADGSDGGGSGCNATMSCWVALSGILFLRLRRNI